MKSRADLCLFFAPGNLKFLFPELGVPQLNAYLSGKGYRVRQADLNALFYADFIRREPVRELLTRRFASRGARAGVASIDLEGIFWGPSRQGGQDSDYEEYARLLGVHTESWRIDDVVRAASRDDALYDGFFAAHVRAATEGVPLVGFTVLSHDQVLPALYLARRIKARSPKTRVVLGGSWCTASRGVLHRWPGLFRHVDFVVFYGGEKALEGLILHGRGLRRLAEVPNLAFLDGKKVRSTPLDMSLSLDALPPPAFDSYDLSLYPLKSLPYQTSSGCEWGRCLFCYHRFPENRVAAKDPDRVVAQIEWLKRRHRVSTFWFADLAVPPPMLRALSERLIRRDSGIFWSALVRADPCYTPEFARQLKRSGCIGLFFGLETSSPSGLRRLDKGLDLGTFERCVDSCSDAGIVVNAFVLNYPGQAGAEFRETLDYVFRKRKKIIGAAMARFELARSSRAMSRLGELGISLQPDADLDIRSFSLPYQARKDIGDSGYAAARDAMRERYFAPTKPKHSVLLIRPPEPRGNPGGSLSGILGIARQLRQRDCALRLLDRPGPDPRRLRKALGSWRPHEIFVTSGFVHDCLPVRRTLAACKEAFPGVPVTLGGLYATLCPEHARGAGADRVFTGRFFEGELPPDWEVWERPSVIRPGDLPVWVARGCSCGRGDCAVGLLEGTERIARPEADVLAELQDRARTGGMKEAALLGTASLTGPDRAFRSLLDAISRAGLGLGLQAPEGLDIRALDAATARALRSAGLRRVLLLPRSAPAAGIARELAGPLRMLARSGFAAGEVSVRFDMGGPGQTLDGLRAALAELEPLGCGLAPARYAPTPGTSDFAALGARVAGLEPAALDPSRWPLACAAMPAAGLEALFRRLSRAR